MRIVIIVCGLIVTSAAVANKDCSWSADLVSANAAALAPAKAMEVSTSMTTGEIVKRLGPAARDVGAGLYVLEWDLTDGRVFRVSALDVCSQPVAVGVG